MSTFMDPRCGVPTFLQTDVNTVRECGVYSGYILATILTLMIIVFIISLLFKKPSDPSDPEQVKKNQTIKMVGGIIGVLLILLAWIFVPRFTSFTSVNSWETYQNQISQYMKEGLSRQGAINKLQSLYQTQEQANAILAAGAEIANSRGGFV